MKLPIPLLFIYFVIFMAYLAYKRNRQRQNQDDANESFLERERLANNTRKKDISGLNYLSFSVGRIPVPDTDDEKLAAILTDLKRLAEQKIIDLSQYSNTDLKLMYGPANLPALSEYDDNYHKLANALLDYANCQLQLGFTDAAIAVLEYAVELRIRLSQIYLLLAKLYREQQTPEKIKSIRDALSETEESFQNFILPKLNGN